VLIVLCFCCYVYLAVRENRTRGGRNKFGPIYRRDRALRRQIQMQRLHGEGVVEPGSYFNDKLFFRDFASLPHDIDVKPTAAELAAAAASQSPTSSSLHAYKDRNWMFGRRQVWKDLHQGGGCSADRDFTAVTYPLLGCQTGGAEMIDPVSQRSIDDMAATAAADTFNRRSAVGQDQSSRLSYLHRQQTYQPSGDGWQYSSAPSVLSYNLAQQSACETSRPISVNYSPGLFDDARCSEFLTKPPGGTTVEMPQRCHYVHSADVSSLHTQYSTSNVAVSQYRMGVSHEPGLHAYHHRHRRHHPQYSYHHHQQQQVRSAQQPPQLPSSLSQSPEVKQAQPDEPVSGDGTSPEFVSEADVAAQRLPGTLKLIDDLQRHDARLRNSVDQLRCYADELLDQLRSCVLGSGGENAAEFSGTVLTRQMIVMACQLCDQALFVLVEWARHAHFFRQLPVSNLFLCSIVPDHTVLISHHFYAKLVWIRESP